MSSKALVKEGSDHASSSVTDDSLAPRVYSNRVNRQVLQFVPKGTQHLLDVGCGAGTNAEYLADTLPGIQIHGLTVSPSERDQAIRFMDDCWVADVATEPLPLPVAQTQYDVILLSHVLEHIAYPAAVVRKLVSLLKPGGRLVIAVPNVLNWRYRLRFARGRFEYEEFGIMDATHLRFFSFDSAPRYLLKEAPELKVLHHVAGAVVPISGFLRAKLPKRFTSGLDRAAARFAPNLFGWQTIIVAGRRDDVIS
ncbi:MAG: class I SAM-dependent methyltransferase [Bacteroidota bacterium]